MVLKSLLNILRCYESRTGPNNMVLSKAKRLTFTTFFLRDVVKKARIAVMPQLRQRQDYTIIQFVSQSHTSHLLQNIRISGQITEVVVTMHGSSQGLWKIHWEKSPWTNPNFLKNLFDISLSSSIWTQGTRPSSRTFSITLLSRKLPSPFPLWASLVFNIPADPSL